jgi:hypothetical protein
LPHRFERPGGGTTQTPPKKERPLRSFCPVAPPRSSTKHLCSFLPELIVKKVYG